MEDTLFDIANFYKSQLKGNYYYFRAKRTNDLLEFIVFFDEKNFKHLTGIHKLTDLAQHNFSSNIILEQMLNRELTLSDLEKSVFFNQNSKNRVENFKKIVDCLNLNNILLKKTRQDSFNSIDADFLLTYKDSISFPSLFLKKGSENIAFPISFFINSEITKYTRSTKRFKIDYMKKIDYTSIKDLTLLCKEIRYNENNKTTDDLKNKVFIFNNDYYKINHSIINNNIIDVELERFSDGCKFSEHNFCSKPIKDFKLNLTSNITTKNDTSEKQK